MAEKNPLNTKRYAVAEHHKSDNNRAAVLNKNNNSNTAAYHSTQELYPNVIRIEPLGYHTRRHYLGTLHKAAEAVKYAIAEQLNPDGFKPFYGIISPDEFSNIGLTFGSTWSNPAGGTAGVDKVTSVLTSPAIAMPMGAAIGQGIGENVFGENKSDAGFKAGAIAGLGLTAVSGAISETSVGKFAGKFLAMGTSLRDKLSGGDRGGTSAYDTFGIDPSSTGSATMKYFKGATFNASQSITVEWYMPEQEDLFRLSIRRLLQLAYVRDMKVNNQDDFNNRLKNAVAAAANASFVAASDILDDASGINDGVKATGNAVYQLGATEAANMGEGAAGAAYASKEAAQKAYGVVDDAFQETREQANKNANELEKNNGKFGSSSKQNFVENGNKAVEELLKTMLSAERFRGLNHTLIPFPVRITIGNILDIEPMVITSVRLTNSKETFINNIGAHIPITIKAQISFDPWLIPGPNHDFIRYLGDNVFEPMPGGNIKGGR